MILSVTATAPLPPPAADARRPGFRAVLPPRLELRQVTQVGAVYVEFIGLTPPTQAEVDAFVAAQTAGDADRVRIGGIDADVAAFNFGGATLAQLKAMSNAEFNVWWAANVTSLAQANAVLKLLAKAALHRLL